MKQLRKKSWPAQWFGFRGFSCSLNLHALALRWYASIFIYDRPHCSVHNIEKERGLPSFYVCRNVCS